MTCDTALERMLEAGPSELRGADGGELARHIARCERCAPVAAALLAELEALDQALAGFGDADASAAADAALAASRADAGGVGGGEGRPRGTRSAPWIRRVWVPLAAAAALTGILVLGRDEGPFPTDQPPAGPAIEPRVSVEPPADRGAAIMETGNPNITIVWLYEREGT